MRQQLYRLFIELTNGPFTSAVIRKFSQSKSSKFVIPTYAKLFDINTAEMENPLNSYQSLHDLFIRNLKANARPINEGSSAVISPVDAVIEQIGKINKSKEIIVKNKRYSIIEMFANEAKLEKYLGGTFMIFYLSPRDYHRIHSPVSGQIIDSWTLGKKSYPVNKYGLKYGKAPLAKNYRTITEIKHESGHIAVIKVGAMFVNSIEKTYINNDLIKGNELAYFSFGSTVILFFERNTFTQDSSLQVGNKIKVGEIIGNLQQLH